MSRISDTLSGETENNKWYCSVQCFEFYLFSFYFVYFILFSSVPVLFRGQRSNAEVSSSLEYLRGWNDLDQRDKLISPENRGFEILLSCILNENHKFCSSNTTFSCLLTCYIFWKNVKCFIGLPRFSCGAMKLSTLLHQKMYVYYTRVVKMSVQ